MSEAADIIHVGVNYQKNLHEDNDNNDPCTNTPGCRYSVRPEGRGEPPYMYLSAFLWDYQKYLHLRQQRPTLNTVSIPRPVSEVYSCISTPHALHFAFEFHGYPIVHKWNVCVDSSTMDPRNRRQPRARTNIQQPRKKRLPSTQRAPRAAIALQPVLCSQCSTQRSSSPLPPTGL